VNYLHRDRLRIKEKAGRAVSVVGSLERLKARRARKRARCWGRRHGRSLREAALCAAAHQKDDEQDRGGHTKSPRNDVTNRSSLFSQSLNGRFHGSPRILCAHMRAHMCQEKQARCHLKWRLQVFGCYPLPAESLRQALFVGAKRRRLFVQVQEKVMSERTLKRNSESRTRGANRCSSLFSAFWAASFRSR
jgi:hypothetical protein